jgi:hypothetical protein
MEREQPHTTRSWSKFGQRQACHCRYCSFHF